jgi:regulator of protease activity HflC (stomatin/prohibitin superfamily)
VPVSFLAAMLPIQYRIRNVIDYAYHHEDAPATLRALAEREVTDYLASANLLDVMSTGRGEATRILAKNLQAAADAVGLGIEIVHVNFHDAHPPIEQVAPSFQAVVGAQEEKEARILAARSYEKKTLPGARAEARKQTSAAAGYANQVIKVAAAEMERFGQQVLVYRTMPEMFILRTYLDFLERDCLETRKYVVPESMRDEVFIINLEEKAQLDLLSADLSDIRETAK